jgi:hypothetical protein
MREARRRFLQRCGRFAAITPPTVTLMLAGGASRYAAAQSGGQTTRDTGDSFLGLRRPESPVDPAESGQGTPGIRG